MRDLFKEAKEALDAATEAAAECPHPQVGPALIKIVDAVSAVMACMGVPNAIEPETGKAEVTTTAEIKEPKAKAEKKK